MHDLLPRQVPTGTAPSFLSYETYGTACWIATSKLLLRSVCAACRSPPRSRLAFWKHTTSATADNQDVGVVGWVFWVLFSSNVSVGHVCFASKE